MLLRRTLRACLLAILVSQVLAQDYYRRQEDNESTSGGAPPSATEKETSASSTPVISTPSSTPVSSTNQPGGVSSTTGAPPDPNTTTNPPVIPSNTQQPGGGSSTNLPGAQQSSLDVVIVSGSDTTIVVSRPSTPAPGPSDGVKSDDQEEDKDDSPGIGTGPIVGMSVAGGLAVIGIIAFFVWKFTRKRFSTFDDNEPIKWPDLNSHGGADSHPLPVRDTGRAGFETGSETSLSRVNSGNYSNTDFSGHQDPYAVPPLPHLNPNQPYRDDPTSAAGYYDPYRGPVPPTVEHGQDWQGEAIPMNQIHAGGYDTQQPYNTGRQSPGPMQAYDTGRASPGPMQAYDAGRASPAPNLAYQNYDQYDQTAHAAGRQSPGPMAAYGGGGATQAYNAGYSSQPPSYAPR